MVRADAAFEAIYGFVRGLGLCARSDARIYAEHIQWFRRKFVGERAHRIQRGQVADHGHAAAGLLRGLGGARAVAVRVVDRVASPDQPFGRVEPYALGGAGDRDVEGRSAGKKYRGERSGDFG